MRLRRSYKNVHSIVLRAALKLLLGAGLALSGKAAPAQNAPPDADPALRAELTKLLQAGALDQAVRRAQAALQRRPDDAGVRQEYVNLHLALARTWLAEHRFADSLTALEAVLAAEPAHAAARALRREILAARAQAGRRVGDVQRLLRLELFDAALERIKEIRALRPDLSAALASAERAAWLGAADDHYLAGNSNEAFALYEHLVARDASARADVRTRWAVSLALTLAAGNRSQPLDPDLAERLRTRVSDARGGVADPQIVQIIAGLLAERSGRPLAAGQAYAAALGETWKLPPADQRGPTVQRLRGAATDRLRAIQAAAPTRRRGGTWLVVLPDTWKQRRTAHFDVYSRNDLIAERIAEAAEFHLAGISAWLGVPVVDRWQPRCELRVHANLADMQQATGTRAVARAVSRTRVQGERVLSRRLDFFQSDPLLLNTTLPNELAHLLLDEACRGTRVPPAIIASLARQAEPPARRLWLRRQLGPTAPNPGELLASDRPSHAGPRFVADCAALTELLLRRLSSLPAGDHAGTEPRRPTSGPAAAPLVRLRAVFRDGLGAEWWRAFGWESEEAMRTTWEAWHAARRNPPRMPLMIRSAPAPEPTGKDGG